MILKNIKKICIFIFYCKRNITQPTNDEACQKNRASNRAKPKKSSQKPSKKMMITN
jgi:hypothetical protein